MDESKDMDFFLDAHRRYKQAEVFENENFTLAEEDYRFGAGDHWPEAIKQQRQRDKRPCLSINRLPQFIAQVVNDARQNAPSVKVHPTENGDKDIAKIYEGLIRNIESQSDAQVAYMHAFDLAVRGGCGHFRITTEYSDDDSFEQDIRIRRIISPFAVHWDPNAKLQDKSDADWCFVTEWITKEAFKDRWPDKIPSDWEGDFRRRSTVSWLQVDRVRIAEYWYKEPYKKKIAKLENGEVIDITDKFAQALVTVGAVPIAKKADGTPAIRQVEAKRVCRVLMTGHDILEPKKVFPSKFIPIVSVFGPEEFVGERTRWLSLIRYAKDPMRMYSYWQTAIVEKIALAPKAPWVMTPNQRAGFESMWDNANAENRSTLLYIPDPTAPPPTRVQPAPLNAAEIQQSAQAIEDLKATMGIYDASLGNRSNETSGRAILARKNEGDTATFAWIDNLSRSIKYCGRILIDLIPQVYDTERVVRVLGEDGTHTMVTINQVVNGQTFNDLSVGKYDVEISVGPSYQTRRMEAAESMLSFIQAVPEAGAVTGDLIARNMDWPGADDFADRLQKALPPQLQDISQLSPEEQQKAIQEQQAQQAAQQRQQQIAEAQAMAEVEAKQVDTALTKAKVAQIVQETIAQEIENKLVMEGKVAPNGAPFKVIGPKNG